ncbi:MAG TPA: 16S rRNA (cytosine(1402)-N(4))-methyltransferase RsmH [Anaerolineaceae bacterium]|jgi:16S rRNA (cytosine1402-N4)-methyltransferase|nr:16S rRNA (cytosine(1402)-N(4))-methyltransferase RsmH [Anaerolineaceae bacterium]
MSHPFVEDNPPPHVSVLYQEILNVLSPESPGRYVDATIGAGGHAWGILKASSPDGELLGFELDPQALEIANQRLAVFGERVHLRQASYVCLGEELARLGWDGVQGVVMDLGVSSMELDTAERGFSFQADGPLDMRFDPTAPLTAADLVNHLSEAELANLIWRYGEEPHSRRIARAIVLARPLGTTRQLAQVIAQVQKNPRQRIHPATLTFQALRIAVNDELGALERTLPQAVAALAPGGRLAVISFHSLEDRLVKQFMRTESTDCLCPPAQPVCTCHHRATLRLLTRHAITAANSEVTVNARARSAHLRVAEKLPLA